MCVLWSVSVCLLHMLLRSQKMLLFWKWSSWCTDGVAVMYEVAIVFWSKSINWFRDSANGPNLRLTTDHMYLLHSLDFGICSQLSRCRNCFWLCLLLLLTLHPCRFPFHMQNMIFMRSYFRLFSLAIISVDGYYLDIIIHNSISCRTWLLRLMC